MGRVGKNYDKVLHLLENYPITRVSDIHLCAYFWSVFETTNDLEYAITRDIKLTSPETIIRTRRKVQANGLFVDADAKARRRIERVKMRNELARTN